MQWKHPPIIKIYEALGALTDKRIMVSKDTAKVYSSSGNKFYDVMYDPASNSIMTNDNGSFYKGYLGYPAIAFLMAIGKLSYTAAIAEEMKGIRWKDINQKFKNDFEKTLEHILADKSPHEREKIDDEVKKIDAQIRAQTFNLLGEKMRPPEGY
ncbi:MAG: hypothetical protein WAN50_05005 [Minisyncoccia bacterium]